MVDNKHTVNDNKHGTCSSNVLLPTCVFCVMVYLHCLYFLSVPDNASLYVSLFQFALLDTPLSLAARSDGIVNFWLCLSWKVGRQRKKSSPSRCLSNLCSVSFVHCYSEVWRLSPVPAWTIWRLLWHREKVSRLKANFSVSLPLAGASGLMVLDEWRTPLIQTCSTRILPVGIVPVECGAIPIYLFSAVLCWKGSHLNEWRNIYLFFFGVCLLNALIWCSLR